MNKVIAPLARGVLGIWFGSLVAQSTEVDKNANPTKGDIQMKSSTEEKTHAQRITGGVPRWI
jgi:hypothetical protein